MDVIVSLCKRRGFIFQSSEIYGGTGSCWDYGPLGVELKNNIKRVWWRDFVQQRARHGRPRRLDPHAPARVEGERPRRQLHRSRWSTAGSASGASAPTRSTRRRGRTTARRPRATSSRSPPASRAATAARAARCARSAARGELTAPRQFNLMFRTFMGPVEEDASVTYLRPETAQGIFVNFDNVLQSTRLQAAVRHRADRQGLPQRDHAGQLHLPHARVRADGDRVLREPATTPSTAARPTRRGTIAGSRTARPGSRATASTRATCGSTSTRRTSSPTTPSARSTSSTSSRWAGASWRGSPTARTSISSSTRSSAASRSRTSTRSARSTSSPSSSSPRPASTAALLAFLLDAYREEEVRGEKRVVLRLPSGAGAGQDRRAAAAQEARGDRRHAPTSFARGWPGDWVTVYDDTAAIGRLYRRQDEVGTPYCVTVDVKTVGDTDKGEAGGRHA